MRIYALFDAVSGSNLQLSHPQPLPAHYHYETLPNLAVGERRERLAEYLDWFRSGQSYSSHLNRSIEFNRATIALVIQKRIQDVIAIEVDSIPAEFGKLSTAELNAVCLLPSGLSQREIAERMQVTRSSVQTHLRRASDKLETTLKGIPELLYQWNLREFMRLLRRHPPLIMPGAELNWMRPPFRVACHPSGRQEVRKFA